LLAVLLAHIQVGVVEGQGALGSSEDEDFHGHVNLRSQLHSFLQKRPESVQYCRILAEEFSTEHVEAVPENVKVGCLVRLDDFFDKFHGLLHHPLAHEHLKSNLRSARHVVVDQSL